MLITRQLLVSAQTKQNISDSGVQKTGLTKTLSRALSGLSSLPAPALMFLITLAASITTEFASNVAILSILVPIVLEMVCTCIGICH